MARLPAQRATDDAAFSAYLTVGRVWLIALIPILIIGAVVIARGSMITQPSMIVSLAGAVSDLSPIELTATAAEALDTALTSGAGITFEVVQRQVLVAPDGGPPLEIPDPTDRDKVLGLTDRYELHVLVERGIATPDGFWSEILAGPPPDDLTRYDPDKAEVRRQALVRDGTSYRDDGSGWYETDALPGIGLDPATLARLAATVRGAEDAKDVGLEEPATGLDGVGGLHGPGAAPARALAAELQAADLPGVIAIDAAAATAIVEPATYRFDASGRLVGLTVIARNTAMDRVGLIVETVYAFAYPDTPPELPAAEPRYVPTPAPADEEAE